MIVWSAIATFLLLKFVGMFIPLRMSEENMEIGDTAEHGHEVYPSDIPSLGYPKACLGCPVEPVKRRRPPYEADVGDGTGPRAPRACSAPERLRTIDSRCRTGERMRPLPGPRR